MKTRYITTPIYYVNDVPHIGHAYTTVAADILARYYKIKGEDVFFLTGTDEHGAKIAEAAEKAGQTPKEFVNGLVPRFQKSWEVLGVEYDEFFRTTNPKHEEIVQAIVKKLEESGYVEKREYEGLYCVGCERYYTEEELMEGKCPDHGKAPVCQKEENYFFLLSKFEKKLLERIEKGDIKVEPKSRKNEVIGKIKQGLEDVSISREAVEWGISYPGDDSQTIYVWIDALINYLSAATISQNSGDSEFASGSFDEMLKQVQHDKNELWPPNIHLMAKDILWFHAVIWPAILMALDIPLPKNIFAHGFFTIGGKKMSKSVGNVLDPVKMVEKFGADAVRYALFREFPFGEDGDISEKKLESRYLELGNGLGNLVSRVATMIDKYFDGEIPEVSKDPEKHPLRVDVKRYTWKDAYGDIGLAVEEIDLHLFAKSIENFLNTANGYVDETKPWELAKSDKEELAWVLYGLADAICQVAWMIWPIMPEISKKIAKSFGIKALLAEMPQIKDSYTNIKPKTKVTKPKQLFPRLEA